MTFDADETFRRALASLQAGQPADAERAFKQVLRAQPRHAGALNLLAIVMMQSGRLAEAEEFVRRAAKESPGSEVTFYNYGLILKSLGRPDEALERFSQALAINAAVPETWNNRGVVFNNLGRFSEAVADFDKALAINANYADALCNKAKALAALKRFDQAINAYDKALVLNPALAEAWIGRGNVNVELNRYDDAFVDYDKALNAKPYLAEAWVGRGNVFARLQRHDEACEAYDRAFALDPALKYLEGDRLHANQFICNWTNLDAEISHLLTGLKEGKPVGSPFVLTSIPASPADRQRCAQLFCADKFTATPAQWQGTRYKHDRIRVAYLSADFCEHAVSVLLAGVLECHDKSRFEIAAISWAPDGNSAMRDRIRKSVDRFVDVAVLEHAKIAELLRSMEVDIAVDLMGFTLNSRTDIFARRPAPVQVNYLGYPGTMGSEYYDYIIADKTVIPDDQRAFYAEQVVWLPNSYQANDQKRRIAEQSFTRIGCGLPENGFIFCSFNNTYKITPDVFDVWMRLLQKVNGSVLWLLDAGATTSKNLRREAEQRGVSAERLIFAPRMRLDDHLARHRLADLFLDTLPYNAHTTASDALWAGLPIVTCLGPTFAGRVAASLLKAVGLGELVTATLADYEALALKLARDPELLGALKRRLASNRLTAPLFDTPRYTRHIETAYVTMWERCQRGEPPAHFAVNAVE